MSVLVGVNLVGGAAALVSWSAQKIIVPELQLQAEACDPMPEWQVIEDFYKAIKPLPGGWTWKAQGYIGMHPCQAGTLTISGYGVEAGGDWPLLIASLDADGIGSWKFDQERNFKVDVPHGGRITLAFMNAYYNAEQRPIQQRQLYLEQVRFTPRP